MGGPWFAVHETNGEWRTLSSILLSNGVHHERARVDLRLTLLETPDEN